ncbi:MAG: hypothetical protein AB1422_06240 [bacterium]
MKKLISVLFLILICHNLSFGEIKIPTIKIEDENDIWELYTDNEISWNDYEILNYLYQHPIDLNTAKPSEIQELPNISFDLAYQIYNQRPYKTTLDIIPIVGNDIFEQIKVFIQVEELLKGKFDLWSSETLEDNKKAEVNTKLGIYTKNIKLGGFGQREEEIKLKKRYLMWPQILIGNYQARFGEGITFNSAHRNSYQGVVPDDMTRKSDIQDGIFIETSFDNLNSAFFYSCVDLSKFPNNVLSEFDGKEELWGGNLNLVKGDNHIGLTGYISNFNSKDENKRIEILGMDFMKRINTAEIAAEIAKSKNQGTGIFLRGYKKISNFKYWLSLRRYEQDFINPHSQIKEGDEKGGEAKIEYSSGNLKLTGFVDYHKHPSIFITDETYWGCVEHKLSSRVKIRGKIEYEDKDIVRAEGKKTNYSFELDNNYEKFDIKFYYKYTSEDKKISDYAYAKWTYYFNPGITFTSRFKYGSDEKRETYGQIKIKRQGKELITKYTYTSSEPHPQAFYFKIKVIW